MDYVSISVRTQKQRGGGRECMCWMQMVLNCCLCFPSGMKHSLSLSFRQRAVGLMFWVNELSVYPSPAAPPPSCFHFLLKVEMLVHWLWSQSCSGVSHFAALHTQMPLGVQLPILTCNRGWPCIWSLLLSLLFQFFLPFFFFISVISNDTPRGYFAGRGVNSPGLYRHTCLTWAADCIELEVHLTL